MGLVRAVAAYEGGKVEELFGWASLKGLYKPIEFDSHSVASGTDGRVPL